MTPGRSRVHASGRIGQRPEIELLDRRVVLAVSGAGEFLLNTTSSGVQQSSGHGSVASSSIGSVGVWESYGQDAVLTWGVYGQRFDAMGNAVGGEFLVNSASLLSDQRSPAVTMNATGAFAVAWEGRGLLGVFPGIYVQRYDASGVAIGAEIGVDGSLLLDVSHVSIGMADDGGFVVVYEANDTLVSRGVFARRYDSTGTPLGAAFQVNPSTSGVQQAPSVAVRGDGSFVVVWDGDGTGDSSGVFARAYDTSGVALGGEVLINGTTAGDQVAASVAVTSGGYVVAWSGGGAGDSSGVFTRAFNTAGAAVTTELACNLTTSGTQAGASIAIDSNGDWVVAWSGEGTGDSSGAFWREFASNGTPRAGEQRINTTTTGVQQRVAISASGDNDYALNWSGEGGSDADGVLAATLVNQAPVVANVAGSAAFTENGAAVAIDPGITIDDADSNLISGATVSITGNFSLGADVLAFTDQLGISGSWNGLTGVLTLSGAASVANYQAALRTVTFVNTSENPSTAARTVTFAVTDAAGGSGSDTRGVNLTSVNDAPGVSAPGPGPTFTENGVGAVLDAGFTITDVDSSQIAGATIAITGNHATAQDALLFTDQLGISGSWNFTTGILTFTGTASLADYQAALRSIRYFNSSDDPSTLNRTIELTVTDGAATSAAASVIVTVVAVNDAPSLTTPGPAPSFTENGTGVVLDATLTAGDTDSALLTGAAIAITANFASGHDALLFTDQLGISGSWNAATGVLTLTGAASVADYQAALRTVRYINSSENPSTLNRTIEITITDGAATSSPDSVLVTVIAVNDAPVLTAPGPGPTYSENGVAVVLDAALTVGDLDSTQLSGAVISISGNFAAGQDALLFVDQLGIAGLWNAATGVLSLSGTASVADYQVVLRTIRFINSSDNPTTLSRDISITVNDGGATSSAVLVAVDVTATNDAPTIIASPGVSIFFEGGPAIAIDPLLTIADADSATVASATVRISGGYATGQDVLSFTSQFGITSSWDALAGTLTLTGVSSLGNYQAALRSVRFGNASPSPMLAVRTIEYAVNDGVDGSLGAIKLLTVSTANDPPAVTTSTGTAMFTENAAPILIDPGITVSDADDPMLNGAAVRFIGGYQANVDVLLFIDQLGITGTWNPTTGTLTLSGAASPASYQAALRSVRFGNASDAPAAALRTIEFAVSDAATTTASARGLVVSAVNDMPTLTNASGPALFVEGAGPTVIAGGISVADVDSLLLTSARVQLTAGYEAGIDSLIVSQQFGVSVWWSAATATLTLTGAASPTQYQELLRSVRFTNTSQRPSAMARAIQWMVSDGSSESVAVTTFVTITPVNDNPLVQLLGGQVVYTEDEPGVTIDAGLGVVDADLDLLVGASVRISSGFASGEDELSMPMTFGLTAAWDASTGVLTLSGTASVTVYQAAMRSIAFRHLGDAPAMNHRVVEFTVSDGAAWSSPSSRTVQVVAVNDAPQLHAAQTSRVYVENGAAVALAPDGIITDNDSLTLMGITARIRHDFRSGQEELVADQFAGINSTWDASTGVLTFTGAADASVYLQLLRSIAYVNRSDAPTALSRVVDITLRDESLESAPLSVAVSVQAIEDRPQLTAPSETVILIPDGTSLPIAPHGTLADADSTTLGQLSIRLLSGRSAASMRLVLGITPPTLSGVWDDAAQVLTLAGDATLLDYQSALRSIGLLADPVSEDTTVDVELLLTDSAGATTQVTWSLLLRAAPLEPPPNPPPVPEPPPTPEPEPAIDPPSAGSPPPIDPDWLLGASRSTQLPAAPVDEPDSITESEAQPPTDESSTPDPEHTVATSSSSPAAAAPAAPADAATPAPTTDKTDVPAEGDPPPTPAEPAESDSPSTSPPPVPVPVTSVSPVTSPAPAPSLATRPALAASMLVVPTFVNAASAAAASETAAAATQLSQSVSTLLTTPSGRVVVVGASTLTFAGGAYAVWSGAGALAVQSTVMAAAELHSLDLVSVLRSWNRAERARSVGRFLFGWMGGAA